MIKIENVTYGYRRKKNILKNISLDIQEKETVVIMGKNGSGKSTLGKLISGILKPKEGKILIDNLEVIKKNYEKKLALSFKIQKTKLYLTMFVMKYLLH